MVRSVEEVLPIPPIPFWNILEVAGTAAFAASGALAGIRKGFDFFGVLMSALVTAVGGGILRDALLGNLPPTALLHPTHACLALAVAAAIFLFPRGVRNWETPILYLDALGLGAFTANGSELALQWGCSGLFPVLTFGLLTGVGGGVLRDVLLGDPPMVFRREIYALASLAGGASLYFCRPALGSEMALWICFGLVSATRIHCFRRDLHLPVARQGE